MKTFTRFIAMGTALALAAPFAVPALAQIITSNVTFPRGATGTTISGTIAGDQTRDYALRASAGQTLRVTKTGSPIVYFNILPPGSSGESVFTGSRDGNTYSGQLASSGAYKIRVYQMRATARRGQSGSFRLNISVTGRGSAGAAGTSSTAGLVGMDGIKAFDVMTERGFVSVDTLSGGGDVYGTWWKASTRECVQLNSSGGRIVAVERVPSHPKCR